MSTVEAARPACRTTTFIDIINVQGHLGYMVSRYELLVQFLNSLFYFGHWFNSLFYFSDQFNLSLYLIYQFKLSIQLTTLFQSPVIILNMNMMQPNLNRTEKNLSYLDLSSLYNSYHLCTIL